MVVRTVDRILEESGIGIARLTEESGLSRDRVEAIVAGRWLPSPVERGRIAAVLQLPVDQIDWGHTMNPRNVRYHRFGLPEDL